MKCNERNKKHKENGCTCTYKIGVFDSIKSDETGKIDSK